MKNITKYILILAIAFVSGLSTACVADLDQDPIDPDIKLPEEVLNSQDAFNNVLAECYLGLAVSSSYGKEGGPHIQGIDGGFGQYMRALFNLQTLPTDEAHICWNDNTIKELHNLTYTTTDVFVTAMFARINYQISICNEFIRRAKASSLTEEEFPNRAQYIAEARALRALSYYHGIDMFGNMPFTTEDNKVGSEAPEQITRPALYKWLVSDIKEAREDLIDGYVYGRVNKDFADMLLAKLYLNCEIFGKDSWTKEQDPEIVPSEEYGKCEAICEALVAKYPALHDNYAELFMADNDIRNNEIIFAVQADGVNTRGYGSTTFVILASLKSGVKEWYEYLGVEDGWGGIRVCPEFVALFDDNTSDKRFMISNGENLGDEAHSLAIKDPASFNSGYVAYKFTNKRSDGTNGSDPKSMDADYPVFRSADAYLMLAEVQLRNGALKGNGATAFNAVRTRSGASEIAQGDITLETILDERGREFYWENMRRQDLIRFGVYTSGYNFAWKGGKQEKGQNVDEKYNLYPIPATDKNTNPKLIQNPGWDIK